MKIRTQLVLAFSSLVIFSFVVAGVTAVISARSVLLAVLTAQHQRQAEMLGAVSEHVISHEDMPFLWRYMGHLDGFPGVRYSYLEGDTGYIWAHTDKKYINHLVEAWKRSEAALGSLEHAVRVKVKGKDAATARLGVAADFSGSLTPIIRRALIPPLLKFGGWSLLFSIGLGVFLAFWLARPIRLMTEGARRVGEGDLTVELPVSSKNELGDLARNFNAMVSRLRIIEQMKDEFIQSVSHDLRSPMSAIKMNVEFMLKHHKDRDKLLPEHIRMLNVITSNTMRLNVFVTNMLDAAKMKAGRMEYHLKPVQVAQVARGLEDLYGPSFSSRGITFEVEAPADTPAILVDPERFDQVVSNLISNALKFTPRGGTIAFSVENQGEFVSIVVSDTGKGVGEEEMDKLFKKFEQADVASQKKDKVQGTGLGLYIVKQTVEAMGGSIAVESTVGEGTRFILEMPVVPRPEG